MTSKIILPLDHTPWEQAVDIMEKTRGLVWGYKIRRAVLERGLGVVDAIKAFGKVMLDFKLYDIPSAMTESLQMHIDAGVDITTVHCTSDYDPPSQGLAKDRIAGVTILTSMDAEHFKRYYRGETIIDMVERMAEDAVPRYAYLVCSPRELVRIRALALKKICPGIRPAWYDRSDDQRRSTTPAEAIRNGADLLVIGRPLLQADDLLAAIHKTNAEIRAAENSGAASA
jgi:orotidine-5'-phosphate decarboxylase